MDMAPKELNIDSLESANNAPNVKPLLPTQKRLTIDEIRLQSVSHKSKHPAPTPVIRIAGANFAMRGMLSALTGPPKSGKTTVIGFIMATCFSQTQDPKNTLDIQSAFAGERFVAYLDYEQHVSSTQDLHDKVLRYAGLSETPKNLLIANLLQYSMEERRGVLDTLFAEIDMHLLIIDGLADLLASVNDEETSNEIIEQLALLASKHNTCILVVIHENKGSGSVRGHLGSQMERKCAGLISVRKDREKKIHSIESRLIRIGDDFESVYFQWNEELKCMTLCDAITTQELNEEKKMTDFESKNQKLLGLMRLCFKDFTELSRIDLSELIGKYDSKGKSKRTVDRRIKECVEAQVITFDATTSLYSFSFKDERV